MKFLVENGVRFPNVVDASDKGREVVRRLYRASGVPCSYLIDREGKVYNAWYGYQEGHRRIHEAMKELGTGKSDRDK